MSESIGDNNVSPIDRFSILSRSGDRRLSFFQPVPYAVRGLPVIVYLAFYRLIRKRRTRQGGRKGPTKTRHTKRTKGLNFAGIKCGSGMWR